MLLQRLTLSATRPRDDRIASHHPAIWNSPAMKLA
jgi:hypothetical protein